MINQLNHLMGWDIVLSFILAMVLAMTLPGTRISSEWLGTGSVKIMGLILIVLLLPNIFRLLQNKKVIHFLTVLFCFCVYRSLHRTDLDTHFLLLWVSFIWLVLLSAGLSERKRLVAFSVSILLPLSIIMLSAGLTEIYTSRSISHVGIRISLKGIAGSYIIYSQCCILTFFIAVALFIVSKNQLVKVLFGFFAITAFLGGITSGSRGGALAILAGALFFLKILTQNRNKRHWNIIYAFMMVCVLALIVPWATIWEAVSGEDLYTGSTGLRWYLYSLGIKLFQTHPFIGIGWGEFSRYGYLSQHSGWLQTFVELGVLGGIWEAIVWIMLFRIGYSAKELAEKRGDNNSSVLILGWLSIAASFCFWQIFENTSFMLGTRFYYIFSAAILASYLSLQRRLPNNNRISY